MSAQGAVLDAVRKVVDMAVDLLKKHNDEQDARLDAVEKRLDDLESGTAAKKTTASARAGAATSSAKASPSK